MSIQFDVYTIPPSLNKLLRMHWAQRREKEQRLAWAIAYGMLKNGIPQCKYGEHRKIKIIFHFSTQRRRDYDNYLKVLLDAFREVGLIYDDNPEAVTYDVEFMADAQKGKQYMTIIIEGDGEDVPCSP